MDSNNDGIGDLAGIADKMDYIASLGVDAIWISPFFQSPMKDFGYDISDYRAIDPQFGTMDDFKQMVKQAQGLGMIVILDWVANHTAWDHPWIEEDG